MERIIIDVQDIHSMITKKILVMAGGTGGHVFPALAVAEILKQQGVVVEWLGTAKGIEARLVPAAGYPLHLLSSAGIRGKGLIDKLTAPFKIAYAVLQSLKILRLFKPQCVIGFGGFASAPGGIAAALLRVPLIIHEQNAVAGSTNRLLSHVAKRIFASFPASFNCAQEYVGNPVRASILALKPPAQRFQERHTALRLLVLGGSQGAKTLNTLLPRVLARLPAEYTFEVLHQAGARFLEETQLAYLNVGVRARVEGFVEDMAAAYGWADIVFCRAGATTVTELMAAGVGSILIPYPHATDDHQFFNARFLVEGQAALMMRQDECTEECLFQLLTQIAREGRAPLLQYALHARDLIKPDAAQIIAEACLHGYL